MDCIDVIKVIGLTGLPGAGKGEFVSFTRQFLGKEGIALRYYSLSDELRDEAARRNLPVERPVLRAIANELRQQHGNGVLAVMLSRKIISELEPVSASDLLVVVVDAIRTPEEVLELRYHMGPHFMLVAVEASLDILIGRVSSRARFDERHEVVSREEAARGMILGEAGVDEPPYGHNIRKCMSMADWHVKNEGSLADLAVLARQFVTSQILSCLR